MMIMLRKPMCLITHILEQPQRGGGAAEFERLFLIEAVDLLFLLRQRQQARRGDEERVEGFLSGAELAFAAVDEDNVGERLIFAQETAITAGDHLADAGEIIDPFDRLDAEAAVA